MSEKLEVIILAAGLGKRMKSATVKVLHRAAGRPIIDYVVERFKKPACLLGDCDVAALGEYWRGAGQGYQHVLYMTVGTGIGGSFIDRTLT